MMGISRLKMAAVALGAVAGLGAVQAQAQADPAVRGKLLFLQCAACHAVTANGGAKVGPHLAGIVGRKSASVASYKYSPAMTKAGLTWTEANLDQWLTGPAKLVPGTTMLFPGLPKAEDRKAVIAYLKTVKP
jgi:cytochrome c